MKKKGEKRKERNRESFSIVVTDLLQQTSAEVENINIRLDAHTHIQIHFKKMTATAQLHDSLTNPGPFIKGHFVVVTQILIVGLAQRPCNIQADIATIYKWMHLETGSQTDREKKEEKRATKRRIPTFSPPVLHLGKVRQ